MFNKEKTHIHARETLSNEERKFYVSYYSNTRSECDGWGEVDKKRCIRGETLGELTPSCRGDMRAGAATHCCLAAPIIAPAKENSINIGALAINIT